MFTKTTLFWAFVVVGLVVALGAAVMFLDYWMRRHLDRNDDGIIDDWEAENPPLLKDEDD